MTDGDMPDRGAPARIDPTGPDVDLTVPQRQSPLAIVFLALRTVRSLGITQIVILVVFIVSGPFGGPLILLPSLIIVLLGGLSALAWWRYTFQLVDGELVVHKGVIQMNRLTVPVERIQSISIDQQLLHRATGLVKVSVDTAGSSAAEFTIDAVRRSVAEQLQRVAVLDAAARPAGVVGDTVTATDNTTDTGASVAPGSTGAPLDGEVVFVHGARRLVVTALTMWPVAGLVVLGPLFALGDEAVGEVVSRVPVLSGLRDRDFVWWLIPAVLAVFAVLSVVLNFVRVMLQDWQLTLRATPASLRRTSGLLSKTSTATSVARVQVVSSRQNPLQRRAGLRGVELSNVGEGDLSLAGCDDDQFATVSALAGSAPIARLQPRRRIHRAEVWLAVRNVAIVAAVVAVAAFFVIGVWSVLVFAVVPVVWWVRRRHVRNFRWAIGDELVTSSRVIDVVTQQALLRKANSVRITQTIFERRRGLGRVHLTSAAGVVSVGMLPIGEARTVRDVVLYAAETDTRPWM